MAASVMTTLWPARRSLVGFPLTPPSFPAALCSALRRDAPSQHVAIKNREMRPSSKKHKLRAGTNAGGNGSWGEWGQR